MLKAQKEKEIYFNLIKIIIVKKKIKLKKIKEILMQMGTLSLNQNLMILKKIIKIIKIIIKKRIVKLVKIKVVNIVFLIQKKILKLFILKPRIIMKKKKKDLQK